MHLSFKILNFIPTKNLLSKFQNLNVFANGLSIKSLLHPHVVVVVFFFFFEFKLMHVYLYWNDIHVL